MFKFLNKRYRNFRKFDKLLRKQKISVKSFYLSLVVMCAVVGILLAFFVSMIQTYSIKQSFFIKNFVDKSLEWENDSNVILIYNYCNSFEHDIQKLQCAYYVVCANYNYIDDLPLNILRKTPGDIILQGGVCRDYAALYQSIFNKLDLNNSLILSPSHVYNKIIINNNTYFVDGCEISEGEENETLY